MIGLFIYVCICFILMAIFSFIDRIDIATFFVIPTALIGGGGFIAIFLINMFISYKEYKESILFADLEEYKLPKFKINEKTKRLYEIYNFNIVDKTIHSSSRYSFLPIKIHISKKEGWTTKLYYVPDAIFVNCQNSKYSWWAICGRFEENQFIWDLYHDFALFYEKSLISCTKTETLENTKIKGISQFNSCIH